jgi:hypothetical protein
MISTNKYTKSSYSGMVGCVEVCLLPDGTIGVRDSNDASKDPLVFTEPAWRAFLAGARAGEFDLPDTN